VIEIPAAVLARIRAHGEQVYPEECCGALLGRVGPGKRIVDQDVTLPNARADERRRRFLIEPQVYRDLEQRARRRGLRLLGFYHSHPDHPAQPSAYDLAHALPWHTYLILAVSAGRAAACTAWTLSDSRAMFEPEALAAGEPEPS
jgi:proteasome lid subunit RPN8/RPN11